MNKSEHRTQPATSPSAVSPSAVSSGSNCSGLRRAQSNRSNCSVESNTEHRCNKKMFLLFVCVLSSVFCVFASGTVFAIGGGGAEHAFTWRDWLWPVVNFAILVVVLAIFGRKPITEYFKKRTELIEKSMREAAEAKELAEKAVYEVQERLKRADIEVNKILEAAKKAGETEKEALIAQGESMKKKIIEQTKTNIEFELEKAKKSIKSEAALMALELAEKQIKEKLGEKEHKALVSEYIEKLEARN